jgi:hypothetical protein
LQILRRGLQPNTTTYNALIAAHGKAGNLQAVGLLAGWMNVVARLLLLLLQQPVPASVFM